MSDFDPLAYARSEIRPLLEALCGLTVTESETAEQHAYFAMLLEHLDKCRDSADLADTFVNLSSAAFLGFDYEAEVAVILDQVLEKAETLAETLSVQDRERH